MPSLPRGKHLLLDADPDLGGGAEDAVHHRRDDRDGAAPSGPQKGDSVDAGGDDGASGERLSCEPGRDVDPGEDGSACVFFFFFFKLSV